MPDSFALQIANGIEEVHERIPQMTEPVDRGQTQVVISDTCVVPESGFEAILMDWPWHYRDKLDHPNMRGAAEDHYGVLKPKDLCKLDLDAIAADDCVLFFWITSPQFDVAFWAFDHWIARQKADGIPKTRRWSYTTVAFVWRKMNKKAQDTPFYGLGRWSRSNYEYVLLLTKGKPQRVSKGIRQEIEAPIGNHSSKPESVREAIVELMGDVPRVELFAREQADGWQATGNELDGVDIRDTIIWRNE